ncbi:MAG: hypothetical protein HOW73_07780 [Polyangiaceae bacterium]|nr:hypothetical protein [Polyangiaceae bacterium]
MSQERPAPGSDGYYHPTSEDEIVDLVRQAHASRTKLRVIGSGHSEFGAICPGLTPRGAHGGGKPPPSAMMVALDRHRSITFHDDGIVEVDAGCTFGRDPYDPTGESSWSSSLGGALLARGHALPDLGAISHHTVSGYLSTGSMGGSVQHSFLDAVERIRFVDGKGDLHETSRGEELFDAVGVSMGLYGVITKVWLRTEPHYNLVGRELRKPIDETPVDFFGENRRKIPFDRYLRDMPYARAVWWPQRDFEYMSLWEATRVEDMPLFEPVPYKLLAPDTRLLSLAANVLLTILGNLDDLSAARKKLTWFYDKLDEELENTPSGSGCPSALGTSQAGGARVGIDDVVDAVRRIVRATNPGKAGDGRVDRFVHGLLDVAKAQSRVSVDKLETIWDDIVTDAIVTLVKTVLSGSLPALGMLGVGKAAKSIVPYLARSIVSMFVHEGDSRFQDCWLCGHALDDQLDPRLWTLRFMELSVPIDKAEDMMRRLREYFRAGGDAKTAYDRTGPFSCQVYGGKKNSFWMSQAHGTDVVRFDAFWFFHNADDPRQRFFRGVWEALEPLGFRPHWGKVLPVPGRTFAAYYERQLPRMKDFKRLRGGYDPTNIFLTDYYREHLDL